MLLLPPTITRWNTRPAWFLIWVDSRGFAGH